MDADLDWCLTCGCRIEVNGYSQAYCSPQCHNVEMSSPSAVPFYPSSNRTSSYASEPSHLEDELCYLDDCSDTQLPSASRNTWIGRGEAGILVWAQSVSPGAPCDDEPATLTVRPKLIDRARGPVKPSLCMSRAQPSPSEPSRPILTPQQSLPSLSRDSTYTNSASVLSLTTGSSSYSLATPATGSVVGSLAAFDSRPAVGKSGLLGGLKAHLRAFSSAAAPKEKQRSTTVTRRDSDAEVAPRPAQKTIRRAPSPVSFYHMPEEYAPTKRKEAGTRAATKENATPAPVSKRPTAAVEEHPAFRSRGRKASRVPS
ncbi:hypothetical protein C8Q79DRAFT_1003322 [Trametes meyenii]|nr:hypothetical protein C8Q79DRAFT_1003322 [Trametes meyenii]